VIGRRSCLVVALALLPAALGAQWSAQPGETVRNEFGPDLGVGAAGCRGACGPDCPSTCQVWKRWECVDRTTYRLVHVYDCGTHRGCREHDDCLDRCAERYPGGGRAPQGAGEIVEHLGDWRPIDRNFFVGECSYGCHEVAVEEFGLANTVSWKNGNGPFDGRIRFEYTKDSPDGKESIFRCPKGTELVCTDASVQCVPASEEAPDDAPEPPGVLLTSERGCLEAGDTTELDAAARGLGDPAVRLSVEGPGRLDGKRLAATGPGTIRVRAESVADPAYFDEIEIAAGRCACTFSARLVGDSGRGLVAGDFANFSTRGQASILGGSTSPEAMEDLAALLRANGGRDEVQQKLVEALAGKAAAARAGDAARGSTVGISLVEASAPADGDRRSRSLATAFKIDVLARAAIEPGFRGVLPVANLTLHTGEFTEDGLAPTLFRWDPQEPGGVTLLVHHYDGRWLEGSLFGEVPGVPGFTMPGGRRPRLRIDVDFRTGAFNPLRMENVCLMAQAGL